MAALVLIAHINVLGATVANHAKAIDIVQECDARPNGVHSGGQRLINKELKDRAPKKPRLVFTGSNALSSFITV